MKKWESFRVNKAKVIEDYVRAKALVVSMSKFHKMIKLQEILMDTYSKFMRRKEIIMI